MILKPPKGAMLNSGHPYARGLVGCWLMNEGGGTFVNDLSGNGNTGAMAAGLTWTGGKFGYGVLLNDADSITVDGGLYNATASYTWVFWVKPTALGGEFMWRNGGMYIRLHTGDFIQFRDDTAGIAAYSSPLPLNVWSMVVFTYDHVNASIYINGQFNVSDPATGSNLVLGVLLLGQSLAGTFDNISFYNRALSASEILNLYRSPFCMFEVDL